MKTFRVVLESSNAEDILNISGVAQAKGLTIRHDLAALLDQSTEPVQRFPVTSGVSSTKAVRTPVTSRVNLDAAWVKLFEHISGEQWDVLRVIKAHPEGVSSQGIASELKEAVNSITGYIGGGLRKNIPNAGFAYEQIIETKGSKPNSVYCPGTVLLSRELPKRPPSKNGK